MENTNTTPAPEQKKTSTAKIVIITIVSLLSAIILFIVAISVWAYLDGKKQRENLEATAVAFMNAVDSMDEETAQSYANDIKSLSDFNFFLNHELFSTMIYTSVFTARGYLPYSELDPEVKAIYDEDMRIMFDRMIQGYEVVEVRNNSAEKSGIVTVRINLANMDDLESFDYSDITDAYLHRYTGSLTVLYRDEGADAVTERMSNDLVPLFMNAMVEDFELPTTPILYDIHLREIGGQYYITSVEQAK